MLFEFAVPRTNVEKSQMKFARLIASVILIIASHDTVFAQTAPNFENGWKPYGSYDGSHLDTVNLMNGNLMLHAPLLPDTPQRGSLSLHETLYVTSKDWQVVCKTFPSGTTGCSWQRGGTGVSVLIAPALTVHRTLNKQYTGGQGSTIYAAYGYSLTSADASTHQLRGVAGTEDSNGEATKFDSIDLSGYHLEMSNPDTNGIRNTFTVIDRQGNQYQGTISQTQPCGRAQDNGIHAPGAYQPMTDDSPMGDQYCSQNGFATLLIDSNGNQMNLRGLNSTSVDTMGKPAPLLGSGPAYDPTNSSGCSLSHTFVSSTIFYYNAPDGSQRSIKQCVSQINVHTAFNQTWAGAPISEFDSMTLTYPGVTAVTAIILADGTKWTFDYDSYGELVSVGLPTGGSITYSWTTVNFVNCDSSNRSPVSRAVTARTLNDGQGHSYQWNYAWGTFANGSLTNTATDPLGKDTVHVFTALASNPPSASCNLYETSTIAYQGAASAGHPLQRVDTTFTDTVFSEDSFGFGGAMGNVFATDIVTTVYPSGKVKKVHKDPDTGLGTGLPIFGKVKKELEYDWGQGAPGALLRETDTTYLWETSSAYLTAHLLDLPASVIVKDAGGNRVAETDYVYDEAAYLTTPTPAITTQHVAPPYGVRGNQTTVNRWLNTTNSFIASHANWFDTGEAYQSIDPLGHSTTHSYDPAYLGAYATQTCSPQIGSVTHCVSGTYDFNTGVLTSLTNENATAQASGNTPGDGPHTSNYSYDYMFRITSAQAPPDPANGSARAQNLFTFSAPNVFPVSATRTKSVTNALSDSATSFFDGLGRGYKSQHPLPNGTATVDTTFDLVGHAATVSNPYFTTSDPTYGLTQNAYDVLDRVTQTTKQDGSIASVAYNVITGAHDAVPGANFSGDCTDSTDEAGKQRRACVDGLGRLVMVVEPNPGAGATTATGSITINGSEQVTGGAATSGSASINISGSEQNGQYCPVNSCHTVWDIGTVTITVAGYSKSFSYGKFDTAATVAWNLSCLFHQDTNSPVDASCPPSAGSSTAVVVTARATGFASNYSFTTSSATTDTTGVFSGPSFSGPASGTLTGGNNAGISDTGNIAATVNGTNYTVSFGAGDTGNTIATRLASAMSGSAVVTAVASGNQVNLTSKTVGSSGNATLTASYTWNSVFTQASFTTAASGVFGGYDALLLDNNPYKALYFYDALGNLLCVEQHGNVAGTGCSSSLSNDATSPWRVRRFTYDSLSRLLTATNPESGTITYLYDNDGELSQKTSPAPNQTGSATQTVSFCYDPLHRVTGKGYGAQSCPLATPVVTYTYDSGTNAKGHLTSLTDQAGTATYTYDILGRLVTETRTIAGANNAAISKTVSYDYNLDGSLKTLHYPSGAAVTYTPDSAGRMLSAVDSGSGINYVTGATYGPDSALTGFISGNSGTFAGITNAFSYNKRLQPLNMSATASSQTVFSIGYDFHSGVGTSGSGTNNGNIFGITNYKDTTRNQTFTYDPLNRLISAQNAGTDCAVNVLAGNKKFWGNTYGYDAWGNLLAKTITKCSAENLSVVAGNNNRLQGGYTYDSAGNMTHDATSGLNYTWDQENRLTGAAGYAYTYDGDGNRVRKSTGNLAANGTLYWAMTPGVVVETDLAGTLKSEYVFFDGERVARRDGATGAGGVFYYFSDHLKTASVISDSSGVIKAESDYYPWGGELQFVYNDSNDYKFTGKKRDVETGLDYFGARYFSNGLGRWVSADWSATPSPVPFADLGNPQSLNLYAYVGSNPISKSDDTGHSDSMTGWNQCMHSDACQAAHERAYNEHPVRYVAAPVVVMGAVATAGIFGPEAAIGIGTSIMLRFAPLATATGAALVKARDIAMNAVQKLQNLKLSTNQPVTLSRINSATNALKDHATNDDLKGVMREAAGLLKGGHGEEVGTVVDSLKNLRTSLTGALQNPNLTDEARDTYTETVSAINNFVQKAQPIVDAAKKAQQNKP
jgi:RHS repeat-associated protein